MSNQEFIEIDAQFLKDCESAFREHGAKDIRIAKLSSPCLERLNRLNPGPVARTSGDVFSSEGKGQSYPADAVCAELCDMLLHHKIDTWSFANLCDYLPYLDSDARLILKDSMGGNEARRPSILLRAFTETTPPILAWRDGMWGWELVLGNRTVDLAALQLGQQGVATVQSYVSKIDALKSREKRVSATGNSTAGSNTSSGCLLSLLFFLAPATFAALALVHFLS